MLPEHRAREHLSRLRTMGIGFIILAIVFSLTVYILPTDESNYWLSSINKEGVYVISAFFAFLGLYCLGALWRRRNFI